MWWAHMTSCLRPATLLQLLNHKVKAFTDPGFWEYLAKNAGIRWVGGARGVGHDGAAAKLALRPFLAYLTHTSLQWLIACGG
jgi:hypothetical protein